MKNIILRIWVTVNIVLFMFAACCLDSESWIPLIVTVITGFNLILLAYADNWFREGGSYENH
ncbi:MAG: hypothetical protein IJI25_08915 [Eubacterium sp.]|nr:hypothetical protein [Eubacterium sp.]